MAQQKSRFTRPSPFVDLQRERRVNRLPFSHAELAVVAESDRASVHATRLDRKASMLAFAHRAHVAQRGTREHQRDGRVALAKRRQTAELFGQLHTELLAAEKRIDALALTQILCAEGLLGVRIQRCSEGLQALALQLHTSSCAVTPVAHEMLGARGEAS